MKLTLFLSFFLLIKVGNSQGLFMGVSNLFNFKSTTEIVPNAGIIMGIEHTFNEKHQLLISFDSQYGKYLKYPYSKQKYQTDLLLNFSSESRLFVFKNFSHRFWSVGTNFRYLIAQNYYTASFSYANESLHDISFYLTSSIGTYKVFKKRLYSYSLKSGIAIYAPAWKEYPFFTQVSLLYYFGKTEFKF